MNTRSIAPVRSFVPPLTSSPRFGIRRSSERFGTVGAHRHPYFEILFFPDGGQDQSIASRSIHSQPGTLIFVSPMLPHEVFLQQIDRCYLLYFDLSFLHPELSNSHILDTEFFYKAPELLPFLLQETRDFRIPVKDISETELMFQRINQCYSEKSICSEILTKSLLSIFLCEVIKIHNLQVDPLVKKFSKNGRANGYVKKAVSFIEDNFDRRVTLSEVADAIAVTPNYLTTLLRLETGRTFVELVTELKIIKASELLTYSDLNVAQVSSAVGFEDADYFSRRFRQVVGCSPGKFRSNKVFS
jgi:AraC-like DNA-binding protein